MSSGDLPEMAAQRSQIYEFLALAYMQEPTKEFVGLLKEQDPLKALGQSVAELTRMLDNGDDSELAEMLSDEYTRLFIGPGPHISPHESVFVETQKRLYGKSTGEVMAFVEALGLKYDAEWKGIPDHIGAELELMAKLTHHEQVLRSENKEEEARECVKIQKMFLDDHLNRWVPLLCKRIKKESDSLFYKTIADLTKDFIAFDQSQISELSSLTTESNN